MHLIGSFNRSIQDICSMQRAAANEEECKCKHAVCAEVSPLFDVQPDYPPPQQQMPALSSFLASASQQLPQQPPAAAPILNRADKVVGPSRPPPAAAVAPPPLAAVASAPDRSPAPSEKGAPFQEVNHRESKLYLDESVISTSMPHS